MAELEQLHWNIAKRLLQWYNAKQKFLDFPVYNALGTGSLDFGNQRIHHTPLVVKTNLVPVFEIAGYAVKLRG